MITKETVIKNFFDKKDNNYLDLLYCRQNLYKFIRRFIKKHTQVFDKRNNFAGFYADEYLLNKLMFMLIGIEQYHNRFWEHFKIEANFSDGKYKFNMVLGNFNEFER